MERLFVAYRNNDLYDNYVPRILQLLPPEVEIIQKVFNPDFERNEIYKFLNDVIIKVPTPFYYLSDITCHRSKLGQCARERIYEQNGVVTLDTLDSIFRTETKTFLKREKFEDIFKHLISLITNEPIQIIIYGHNIADHFYECFDYEDELRKKFHHHDEDFANYLWQLTKEQYPKAEIKVVWEPFKVVLSVYGSRENALLICDRHCGLYEVMDHTDNITSWREEIKLFALPFENTISHLLTLGKIQKEFDIQNLYNRIFKEC